MSEFKLISPSDIVLSTLNARYSHASLGLRYLKANMGELKESTKIVEFTIQQSPEDIVEQLLALQPKIIGIGVYIWNVDLCTQVVALLKRICPDVVVVLGGPEVSYEYENTSLFRTTDYLITGWGEVSFPWLCGQVLAGKKLLNKVLVGQQASLETISFPYAEYDDTDIKNRTIYVEASRGCPYKCEFCLSSLDKTAWSFPLDSFMQEMDSLYQRGLRQFKFVDRTFNLKKEFTTRILSFFLEKLRQFPEDLLFLHFELVPDHLPDELRTLIQQFPEGCLQFEIGIQTLNPETQQLISRKTNLAKAKDNILWLSQQTHVHMHVDLIAGLPAETLEQFAHGFNELYSWQADEIQLGVLKRLKGTPIIRHTDDYQYIYSPFAPYSVMQTKDMSYAELNEVKRIAKYWDKIVNSGRFKHTLNDLLGCTPFENMRELSAWLYAQSGQTHSIALDRLFKWLFTYLVDVQGVNRDRVVKVLAQDFAVTGIQGWPSYLGIPPEHWQRRGQQKVSATALPKRQQRHQS